MDKPYADDLRMVAVLLIEGDHTRPGVAESRGISLSSFGRSQRRFDAAGSISPDQFGGCKSYALAKSADRIKRWIPEEPDLTLLEIQARLAKVKVKASSSSVFRFLRDLRLTYKKTVHVSEQDRPYIAAARRRGHRKLDPGRIVFIDEMALSLSMTRRRDRSPRGERLTCKVPFGSWQTTTLVVALRHDRVTAADAAEGRNHGGDLPHLYFPCAGSEAEARQHSGDR